MDLRERIIERSVPEPNSGCWLWLGARTSDGYGHFKHHGRWVKAHRAMLGEPGDCVLHKCDTPACVNPQHLYVGTHADNMRDREQRGRANHPRGAENFAATVSDEAVATIRRRRAAGAPGAALAAQYGLHRSTIHRICTLRSRAAHAR